MSISRVIDWERAFELTSLANQLHHCVEKSDKAAAREILRKNNQDGLLEWTGPTESNAELTGPIEQFNLAVSRARNTFRIGY